MNGNNVGIAHLQLAGKQVSMFHIIHIRRNKKWKGKKMQRKTCFLCHL